MTAATAVVNSARTPNLRGAAIIGMLVTASALFMLGAGHTLAESGLADARRLLLGGGISIQLALYVQRRGIRQRTGHPRRGRAWIYQLVATGVVSGCGLGLVLVGHTAFAGGWWPIGTAIAPLLCGVAVAAAFNRTAAEVRRTQSGPS